MSDEVDLERSSKDLWVKKKYMLIWDYYNEYINDLLPFELNYILIKEEGKLPKKTGGTLVFLVGYTLEPLILSIVLRKPDNVMLIMNNWYDGNSGSGYYDVVVNILEFLQDEYKFNVLPFQKALNSDSPDDVVAHLQKYCSELENVYIDITGGKKSMISGAFFYAAYSDTPITYVDFEKYDTDYQRPYGYSCKLADLTNPMKTFALREWENIKNLYEQYSFGSALEIISSVHSRNGKNLTPNEIESIQSLENVIKLYEYWSYSDYEKAKALISKLDDKICIKLPSILGSFNKWDIGKPIEKMDSLLDEQTKRSEVKEFGNKIYKNMFANGSLLFFYINDERYKVERLIRYAGDFRSAIFKAASISEILMRMRLWIISDALLVEGLPTFLKEEIPSIEMSTILRVFKGQKADFKHKKDSLSLNHAHMCLVKQKKKFSHSGDPAYVEFHKLLHKIDKLALVRNNVVHGFMPASKSLAEKALKISLSSSKEFRDGWMSRSQRERVKDGIYEIIPWSELREICHLDLIPEVK